MPGLETIVGAVKMFNNLAVKPLLALAVATGIVLFSPALLVSKLGMTTLVADYRPLFGLAFLVSCTYLLAHALVSLVQYIRDGLEARATRKARMALLQDLTPDEKSRLVPYIHDKRASVVYQITDGVVQGMVAKGILFRSTNLGHGTGFSFNIQPWVRQEIEKNVAFLDGTAQITRSTHDWMGN